MVWIDLEMTGLDPRTDRIIEVATIITDPELNIIAHGPELIINQPAELFDKMDEWNRTHHTKSGLWSKVLSSKLTDQDAKQLTFDFIKMHIPKKKGILAGNSIWQDRRFLQKYWPEVLDYLHYRLLDVSTLKILANYWFPTQRFEKKRRHRALDDIHESIDELRFYRERCFAKS